MVNINTAIFGTRVPSSESLQKQKGHKSLVIISVCVGIILILNCVL